MIDKEKIIGEGSLLWCLIIIDRDDPQDSFVNFWLADSEDHLYEQIKKDWEIDEMLETEFNYDWGYYILPKLIGIA
jgi:hypothetical protein